MSEKDPTGDLIDKINSRLSESKPAARSTGLSLLIEQKKRDIVNELKIDSLESTVDKLQAKHKVELGFVDVLS
jgi:hypothetical protein